MAEAVSTKELSGFIPLNSLSADHLNELAHKSRRLSVQAGQYLFRDGERPQHQLFVIDGTVELIGADAVMETLEGGSTAARSSLDSAAARAHAARAKTGVTALAVDRDLLDLMLTWDQAGGYRVEDLGDASTDVDDSDWMARLLQTECFRRIPPANIQAIFMRMEPVAFKAEETVIRQGEPGEYFYIVRDGRCRVTCVTRSKPDGIRLADLDPGSSFGEEALISDKERNATVTMLTDGTLMRLSKQDFNALLNEPLLNWIDYEDAAALERSGARWIDVRLPPEYEDGHIVGAINVPLFVLRMKAQRLDPALTHIVYCDSGRRSSAASFLLGERGFDDVRILRGGLTDAPPEAIEKGRPAAD